MFPGIVFLTEMRTTALNTNPPHDDLHVVPQTSPSAVDHVIVEE